MSIIAKLPDNARVRYPAVRFVSSALNVAGDYAFENVGNTDVVLIENMNPGSLYLIERISFYASAAESDWLKSMKTVADFPRVTVRFNGVGGASIFGDPFRCVNYVQNCESMIWIRATQKAADLVTSMFGTVHQVSGMVGDLTLEAQINFTIYEITDSRWIKSFEANPLALGATVRL